MDFRGFRFTEEQVDSLLVQCDELAGLLSVWGKRSEEIRHSVHDLSLLVGVELRPSLAPAPSPAVAKSSPISAGWSSPSSGAARSPGVGEDCGDDLGDVDFFIPAKKIDFASRLGLNGSSGSRSGEDRDPGLADEKGSNSSDSSSLHIDVDETWAQRLNDLGGDDAGVFDDPIIRTPSAFAVFGFRTGPHLLERIEEGSQEDVETSSDCQSSGSSEGPASGRSSRDSSLERAWASVPEAGFAAPAAPQEQPLATEAQRGRQSPRPGGDREKKENKKKKEPRKEARAASYEAKAFGGGISKVVASFRTNFRQSGPKEEGPLSRIQEQEMETE